MFEVLTSVLNLLQLTQMLIDLQSSRMEAQTMEIESDQLKKKIQRLEEELQDSNVKCQKLQKEVCFFPYQKQWFNY